MTKRVIQTDLFAAFKESQQLAEQQYGQKRKIHIEGTSLRQAQEYDTTTDQAGYEVIIAKNTAPKVVATPKVQTVATTPMTVNVQEATSTSEPQSVRIMPQPEIKIVEAPAPMPSEPPVQPIQMAEVQAQPIQQVAPVQEETTQIPSESEIKLIKSVLEEKTAPQTEEPEIESEVEPEQPRITIVNHAPQRKKLVARKDAELKQNLNKLNKVAQGDIERITITNNVRNPLKTVKQTSPTTVSKEPQKKQTVAPSIAPSTNSNTKSNILKASVILAIVSLAAIISFNNNDLEVKDPITETDQTNVSLKNANNLTTTPKVANDKTVKKQVVKKTPQNKVEADPIIAISTSTGKNTLLLCSGLRSRNADKLKAFLESHEVVRANGWQVFMQNTNIYVGRFDNRNDISFKKCENFCRNLEYEGRKQFKSAMFFPLPQRIIDRTK